MKKTKQETVIAVSKRQKFASIKGQIPLFLMTLPGMILAFMFSYVPMFGIILAFKQMNMRDGIWGSPWCGWENFSYLFKSNDAYIILRNTLGYNLLFIILGTVLNVTLALIVSSLRNRRTSKVYQTVFIMPHFLSMVIVSYIVLAFLNMENGFLNVFLQNVCGMNPVNWYVEPKYWPYILPLVNFWKATGFSSILYISTISGIDRSLYEAAKVDGATSWQMMKHITIPLLRKVMCIQMILQVGQIFGGDFGLFYQVPMASGALASTTTTIPVYVYKNLTAGGARALGLSSATSFIQSVTGCFLVIVANLAVKKIDPESSLF